MLDVHSPHEPIMGWRDFLLHLITITIGLLIALGLEGAVEWQHHRNLAKDAETSLHAEIASNAKGMQDTLVQLLKEQAALKQDVVILKQVEKVQKWPKDNHLEVTFGIRTFESVSWRTAESTDALSYMPYSVARGYSDIYEAQSDLAAAEQVAARDAIVALAPFINMGDADPDPTTAQATDMQQKIEVLQGQLLIVSSLMADLNDDYKKFLAAQPD